CACHVDQREGNSERAAVLPAARGDDIYPGERSAGQKQVVETGDPDGGHGSDPYRGFADDRGVRPVGVDTARHATCGPSVRRRSRACRSCCLWGLGIAPACRHRGQLCAHRAGARQRISRCAKPAGRDRGERPETGQRRRRGLAQHLARVLGGRTTVAPGPGRGGRLPRARRAGAATVRWQGRWLDGGRIHRDIPHLALLRPVGALHFSRAARVDPLCVPGVRDGAAAPGQACGTGPRAARGPDDHADGAGAGVHLSAFAGGAAPRRNHRLVSNARSHRGAQSRPGSPGSPGRHGEIKALTRPEDRVMWVAPSYIALLADRRGVAAPDERIAPEAYRKAVRDSGADYVFLSAYHPRDTLSDLAWQKGHQALTGYMQTVHVSTVAGSNVVSSVLLKAPR